MLRWIRLREQMELLPRWAWGVVAAVLLMLVLSPPRLTPRGPEVPHAPVQTLIAEGEVAAWGHHGATVLPVAHYVLDAHVLSRARYRWDNTAYLSPLDLAVGWGEMSRRAVLRHVRTRQVGRFAYFRFAPEIPITYEAAQRQSANVHVIPSSPRVRRQLMRLRRGDTVRLEGMLVNVHHERGPAWRTSLSREDDGDGACEILWVTSVERR
jgi:hypothetical protein